MKTQLDDSRSGSQQEMLDGVGIFLIGICVGSAAWFTAATSLRVLSSDVPLDAALLGVIGLEAGVIASAYLFAWAFRRRFYWFLIYILTSAISLSLSYTGTRLSFSAYLHHQQLEHIPAMASLIESVQEIGLGKPRDMLSFFLAMSAIGLPLLVFLGTRPAHRSLSEQFVTARIWMKEMSNQIQCTEGIFKWAARVAKTFLFNPRQMDARVVEFQRQVQKLRETVASSLVSLKLPHFIHEALSLRLTDMCGNVESTAFSAQGKLDQAGLSALNDCLDTVQASELPDETKEEVEELLLVHFQKFHDLSRGLTHAQASNWGRFGKEISSNARSEKTISAQG